MDNRTVGNNDEVLEIDEAPLSDSPSVSISAIEEEELREESEILEYHRSVEEHILDVIRELAESGMTMIIATHEMGFAGDIADRICFLEQGQILEQCPPEQLFGDPHEPRTRQFLERVIQSGRMGGSAAKHMGIETVAQPDGPEPGQRPDTPDPR